MIPNNRNLKAFVRFDGTGRVISSSLILRKKKPKVGNWVEVTTYECCNPVPLPCCDCWVGEQTGATYDFYACDGTHMVCTNPIECMRLNNPCLDVSKPYSGIAPVTINTELCPCFTTTTTTTFVLLKEEKDINP